MVVRIHHKADAQRGGILFVNAPGIHEDAANDLDHPLVAAEYQPNPFIRNAFGAKLRIPSQPPVPVKVGLCQ
ncbi:hypothetical protein D3C74_236490 [compost metagenome]